MSQRHDNPEQTEKKFSKEGAERTMAEEYPSKMPKCCSTDVAEMMSKGCPCKTFIKRHRVAVFTGFTGAALALLTIPVGAVLGIIAFFRTF